MGVATGAQMSSQSATATYIIDSNMSRFTIKAFASGLLSGLGHNPTIAIRGFSGTATISPDNLEDASLQVRIQADSLTVTDDVSQKDRQEIESRMKSDVLATSRFPEIDYDSTKISASQMGEGRFNAAITGDLSLHGVRQSLTFNAQVAVSGATLRGFGEFAVRQTDYDIALVSVAGGTLKVKDELKVSFDILARKQD
jgi:polyisoprenoid-binding protein YceI